MENKVSTIYLINLYIYLSLIFFIVSWFAVYFVTINKMDFIISTLYFGSPLIILLTYLFRHRTLKFAYKYENEIKLLGPFMRLFLYIFTTRFFYGANGNRTMKAIYVFCFQANLISFYISFTIQNGYYLSLLVLFNVLGSIIDKLFESIISSLVGNISSVMCQKSDYNFDFFIYCESLISPIIRVESHVALKYFLNEMFFFNEPDECTEEERELYSWSMAIAEAVARDKLCKNLLKNKLWFDSIEQDIKIDINYFNLIAQFSFITCTTLLIGSVISVVNKSDSFYVGIGLSEFCFKIIF